MFLKCLPVAFVALAVFACASPQPDSTAASASNEPSTPSSGASLNPGSGTSPSPIASQTPAPAPSPIVLSDTGTKASQQFALQSGVAVFDSEYTGSDNFSVELLGPSGTQTALLANTIGNYSGKQLAPINTPGNYLLNVTASGPWTVTITQPANYQATGAVDFKGSGDSVVGPVLMLSGLKTVSSDYQGAGNFSVALYKWDGTMVDLLANTIGSYTGSKAEQIEGSFFYFNIQASGAWTLNIQ